MNAQAERNSLVRFRPAAAASLPEGAGVDHGTSSPLRSPTIFHIFGYDGNCQAASGTLRYRLMHTLTGRDHDARLSPTTPKTEDGHLHRSGSGEACEDCPEPSLCRGQAWRDPDDQNR